MATAAARRLGVHESLLYLWWGELSITGDVRGDDTGFLPVTVALDDDPAPSVPPVTISTKPAAAGNPVVPAILEVTLLGGTYVRMQGGVDSALAASVLKAVAASGAVLMIPVASDARVWLVGGGTDMRP